MKLFHLSDLHLGKRVHGFSLLEDQRYILEQILGIIKENTPDGIMIAGDVYDRSVPSTEAMELFDRFIFELSKIGIPAFIISGNHDSAERLAFASRLIKKSNIFISDAYNGKTAPLKLTDEFGSVNIFMLPFIKPVQLRRYFPEAPLESYSDAVAAAIGQMEIDTAERNILITHQFVTGGLRSDSEEASVGALDNVDSELFEKFDYVALGHLHRPQNIAANIRYCGTPIKYSFSEANNKNSITVVELKEKGSLELSFIPLDPLRDMIEIKGSYNQVMSHRSDHYARIILTDDEYIPYVMEKLRTAYPNIMALDYDNSRTRVNDSELQLAAAEQKQPIELFADFFKKQNNRDMTEQQLKYISGIIDEMRGDDR